MAFVESGKAWGGSGGPPMASYVRTYYAPSAVAPTFETVWFPWLCRDRDYHPFVFHELTDIEVGSTIGVVTLRVGVNPLEILDFLLGFIGLDIANDDPKKKEKPTTVPTLPHSAGASGDQ
jgi:hypothetical protein